MKRFLFSLLILSSIVSFADDDVASDLRKISAAYENASRLEFSIEYKVFENYNTTVSMETENGIFIKEGVMEYSELLGLATIKLEKEKLFLNRQQKTITVSGFTNKHDSSIFSVEPFLKTLGKNTKATKKIINSSSFVVKINYLDSAGQFERVEMYYDPHTFIINKVVLYFRNKIVLDDSDPNPKESKARVEIVFKELQGQNDFKRDVFKLSTYLTRKGDEFLAAGIFKEYKVYNQKKPKK